MEKFENIADELGKVGNPPNSSAKKRGRLMPRTTTFRSKQT